MSIYPVTNLVHLSVCIALENIRISMTSDQLYYTNHYVHLLVCYAYFIYFPSRSSYFLRALLLIDVGILVQNLHSIKLKIILTI